MTNREQRRARLAYLARLAALACISVGLSVDVLHGQGTDLYGDPLPAGAIARLGTTRFRHGSYSVRGLRFLPDGTTLVRASEEHSIQYWDAQSGRLLRELRTDPLSIRGFALSLDGRLVAVAGFWFSEDAGPQAEVRILDAASGKTVRALPRDDRDADHHALAFTPDGKLLISLGGKGILRIEEVATGTEILQQRFAGDIMASLALSPDGSTLAISTGPNTGKYYLWKWQSGEEPQDLKVGGSRPGDAQLSFSPDGRQLAACADARAPIRVWDVESGGLVHQLGVADLKEYFLGNVVYSPDGKTLLALSYLGERGRGAVHWWNSETGEHQGRKDVEAQGFLAMSPSGALLASGTRAGVCVWRWPQLDDVLPIDEAHQGSVSRVAVAGDGTVVTASDDRSIRLWDPATGKQKRKLEHDYGVRDIALSPDDGQLVSAASSVDDTVRLWDLATGREIYRLPGHGRAGTLGVGFSADAQRFASVGRDFYLRVWDVRKGKALLEHKLQPTGVKVPEQTLRSNLEAAGIYSFDQACISPDASLLAIGLGLGKFFVFDANTGQELRVLDNEGGRIVSLAISPGNRYLLASAWSKGVETKLPDGRVRFSAEKNHPVMLWDLNTGQKVRQLVLSDGGVGPVAFSADGLRFAVATSRPQEKITIYDTASGVEQRVIDKVPHRVASLAFAPDGRTLISGLGDSTALVWDLHGK